jgi:hypothetical protein
MTRLSICSSEQQRLGKGKVLGADPLPLIHYQVDSLLQALFLPNLASFLAKHWEGIR